MSSQGDSQPSQDSTMTLMQENLSEVLYFAYGSNLSTKQMRRRCPYSTPVGLAYLKGWRWIINERGYANVVQLPIDSDDDETPEAEDNRQLSTKGKGKEKQKQKQKQKQKAEEGVYGLLYLVPAEDEESLDRYEGVPSAYQKFQVNVKWANANKEEDETLRALVYVDEMRVEEDVPQEEFIERMEDGIEDAVENWGMNEDYADRVMRRFWTEED